MESKDVAPPQEWLDAQQDSDFKEGCPDDFEPTQQLVDEADIKHIQYFHFSGECNA
jgi:hypothetical protein